MKKMINKMMMKRRQDGNDNKWDVVRSDRRTIAFIGAPGDHNSHHDDVDDEADDVLGQCMIYMRRLKADDLVAMVDFLYYGEANINQESLEVFFGLAE